MFTRLSRTLQRLTHPRSRRSQLWVCVYCGAFQGEEPAGSEDGDSAISVE